jgi:hypothetical protein
MKGRQRSLSFMLHPSSFRLHLSAVTSSSVAAYQSLTYQSKLPPASVLPSGEKATARRGAEGLVLRVRLLVLRDSRLPFQLRGLK